MLDRKARANQGITRVAEAAKRRHDDASVLKERMRLSLNQRMDCAERGRSLFLFGIQKPAATEPMKLDKISVFNKEQREGLH